MKVGDRLLSVDGIPLHGASHTTALATLRQCSHEALFQVEYDVAIPGESGARGLGLGQDETQGLREGVAGTDPHHCKGGVTWGQSPSLSEPVWAVSAMCQLTVGGPGDPGENDTDEISVLMELTVWLGERDSKQNKSNTEAVRWQ